jgi:hypothetical protein
LINLMHCNFNNPLINATFYGYQDATVALCQPYTGILTS